MAVYKRGQFYYFEFIYNGERHKVSTKQKNRRVAEEMEATYRSNLAKGKSIADNCPLEDLFTQSTNTDRSEEHTSELQSQ